MSSDSHKTKTTSNERKNFVVKYTKHFQVMSFPWNFNARLEVFKWKFTRKLPTYLSLKENTFN